MMQKALLIVLGLVLASAGWLYVFSANRPNFRLPGYDFSYSKELGVLTIRGTWIIEGADGAFPRQTTAIRCDEDTKQCIEATAILPSQNSIFPLELNVTPTTNWDQRNIQFQNSGSQCATYYYSIDLTSKSVSGIRELRKDVPPGLCDGVVDRPLRLRLTDGGVVNSK